MLKFNLLPISLAAVLVTISLESTHSFSPNVQVLQKRILPADYNNILDDVPERNQEDDDATQQPTPSPFLTLGVPTVSPPAGTDAPDGGTDTVDPCSSNGNGSFGDSSTDAIEIKYDYEMVTVASADIEDTLSKVEAAISAAILNSSFLTCEINRNLAAGLRQKKESITGMSSKPNEKITEDVCSRADVVGDNQCDVVEGQLTLYVEGDAQSHEADIMDLIKNGMNSGSLVSSLASADIIELKYFDGETPGATVENPGQQKAKGNYRRAPIIASAACAAVLFGFCVGKQLMMKKDEESEPVEDSENP